MAWNEAFLLHSARLPTLALQGMQSQTREALCGIQDVSVYAGKPGGM